MQKIVNGELVDLTPEEIAEIEAPGPEALSAYAMQKRWETEQAGIMIDGFALPTNDAGQSYIKGAAQAVKETGEGKLWQVGNSPLAFEQFSADRILALGLGLNALTQATFDKLAEVAALIASGEVTTLAEIDAAFATIDRVFETPET